MNARQNLSLNCDLGETMHINDQSIEHIVMPFIDMANIACGFHAGNTEVMKSCILLALEHGVKVGAHPSYPDRENFGRVSMALKGADIADLRYQQLRTIDAIADECGTTIDYVKPHGALYHDMMHSDGVFQGVLQAVKLLDPEMPLMIMASPHNDKYRKSAQRLGVHLIFEAFADRRYTDQGVLQSRDIDGAVYQDQQQILQQALILASGFVISESGKKLPLAASSLCVHGDNQAACAMIQRIKSALT
jgi:UPF0271 protein